MKDSYYVIFNAKGIDRFCKSEQFQLKANEFAVQMKLEVPDEVFKKPAIPTVHFTLSPDQVRRTVDAAAEDLPTG